MSFVQTKLCLIPHTPHRCKRITQSPWPVYPRKSERVGFWPFLRQSVTLRIDICQSPGGWERSIKGGKFQTTVISHEAKQWILLSLNLTMAWYGLRLKTVHTPWTQGIRQSAVIARCTGEKYISQSWGQLAIIYRLKCQPSNNTTLLTLIITAFPIVDWYMSVITGGVVVFNWSLVIRDNEWAFFKCHRLVTDSLCSSFRHCPADSCPWTIKEGEQSVNSLLMWRHKTDTCHWVINDHWTIGEQTFPM